MNVMFDIIFGLAFGLEYVPASEDADIPNACVVLDIACFRWIFEITEP